MPYSNTAIRLSASFMDINNALVDPSTVTLLTLAPGATTETTYAYGGGGTIVKDGVGLYHQDVVPSVTGTWQYRWQGTGTCAATNEGQFVINPSNFY